jgi:hypothetical protein
MRRAWTLAAALLWRQHEKEFEALATRCADQLGQKIHAASGKVKGEAGGKAMGILPLI